MMIKCQDRMGKFVLKGGGAPKVEKFVTKKGKGTIHIQVG